MDRPDPPRRSVDGLAASAWIALDAAQHALRTTARLLGPAGAASGAQRVAEQRRSLAADLRAVARERHERTLLLDLFAADTLSPAMLGLPADARACVFDVDGVLTTSDEAHASAWAEALDRLLLEHAELAGETVAPFDRHGDYVRHLAGVPRLLGVRAFLASRGIALPEGSPEDPPGAHTLHGVANAKHRGLQRRIELDGIAAFAGSVSYLEALRVLDLPRAVVSASASTDALLAAAGLERLIDVRIDADAISREQLHPLPAPDTLLAACAELGVAPARCVAYETTPVGIVAAHAAGMERTVAVSRNGTAGELRRCGPDVLVGDLGQLLPP